MRDGAASARVAAGWLLAGLILVSLPFLRAEFVPCADMPQHLSQLRLLAEAFSWLPRTVDASQLEVRPFAPNTLVYWLLLPFYALFSAPVAGRLGLLLLLAASVLSLHQLAWKRGRSGAATLLAGMLLFSHPTYWGFLNFLSGVPIFFWLLGRCLGPAGLGAVPGFRRCRDADFQPDRQRARGRDLKVVPRTQAPRRREAALRRDGNLGQPLVRPWRDGATLALGLVALAWAHVMWTCAAAGIVLVDALARREPKRVALYCASALPGLGAVLVWSRSVAAERQQASFDVALYYGTPLLKRLDANWLSRVLFGGISLRFELVASACVLTYLAFGAYRAYQDARAGRVARFDPASPSAPDAALLRAGALVTLVGIFGPAIYLNSIDLSQRFVPYGVMLLLLGAPRPAERAVELGFAAFALSFALYTAVTWVRFNREDLSGLARSLAAVSEPRSVLGLNYRPRAKHVAGHPFLQLFAYFQAEHGGEHNFSFAEHGAGVVVYKTARRRSWTHNLEWHPERASADDVAQFDCALVNGTDEIHATFRANTGRRPHAEEGFFRLYCRTD